MQPIMVMFFQSEESLEEYLMVVFSPVGSRVRFRFFLADLEETPQREPCCTESWLGGDSEVTLQPASIRAVFNFW